jgi:uroporphyrinogen decarboxylase
MTPRERVLTAMKHQEADRFPIDLGGCSTGIEIEAYEPLKRLLGLPGPTRTFMRDHVEIDEPILQRLHVDTRYVRVKPPSGFRIQMEADYSYVDYWGVRWKKPPSSLYWDIVENPIKEPTLDALAAYPWPDPKDPSRFAGLRNQAKELHQNSEYAVVMDAIGFGVFGQAAHQLRGFQNFLMDLILNPKFAEALLDRVADFHATLWSHILDEVGEYIDVAMVLDDVATQNGPMMSLDIYRKLIKPAHRKVWGLIKKKTRAALFLHSCGSVRQLIPDFMDLGVDILNPIQVSAADMDPKRLKAEYGKDLVFWGGGCDTQQVLPFGTPAEVKKEVKRRIGELAPGGGFVFNQVHNIQPRVPAENILMMLDTAFEAGAYPIHI